MGTYYSFPDLFIWLPLLGAFLCFVVSKEQQAKTVSLLFSLMILGVSICSMFYLNGDKYVNYNNVNYIWLKYLGASYFIGLDGTGRLLTFLTAISFPMIS